MPEDGAGHGQRGAVDEEREGRLEHDGDPDHPPVGAAGERHRARGDRRDRGVLAHRHRRCELLRERARVDLEVARLVERVEQALRPAVDAALAPYAAGLLAMLACSALYNLAPDGAPRQALLLSHCT